MVATNQRWFKLIWTVFKIYWLGLGWTQYLKLSLPRKVRVLFSKFFDYFILSEMAKLGGAIKTYCFKKCTDFFHYLNKLLKWSEIFCKFSTLSLECQICFYTNRIFFPHSRSEQFWKQNMYHFWGWIWNDLVPKDWFRRRVERKLWSGLVWSTL